MKFYASINQFLNVTAPLLAYLWGIVKHNITATTKKKKYIYLHLFEAKGSLTAHN